MIALTVLPSVFNIYDFKTPGALVRPWLAESFTQIVPDWWKNIYPVTYYFIGAYIRRNVDMKKLKTPALFAAYLAAILLSGIFKTYGKRRPSNSNTANGAIIPRFRSPCVRCCSFSS